MGLFADWANLGAVALPFLASLTVAAALALALKRAAERSGLPHQRDRCPNCPRARELAETGECLPSCAVNQLPTLPLVLFVTTASLALLALFTPGLVLTFIVPWDLANPTISELLVAVMAISNAIAAVALTGFFTQDLDRHREEFVRGAVLVAFGTLAVAATGWAVIGPAAGVLVPLALGTLLFAVALHVRGIRGEAPFVGLRSIAAATAPLFLLTLFALVRIGEIWQLATGR